MTAIALGAQPLRIISLLPRISTSVLAQKNSKIVSLYTRQVINYVLPAPSFAVPAFNLNVPAWLSGIWGSILRAVPKKKTSHSKKRHRQMAGKALKDVNSLCTCPACGQVKRQHIICPHCLSRIKDIWANDNPSGKFV